MTVILKQAKAVLDDDNHMMRRKNCNAGGL